MSWVQICACPYKLETEVRLTPAFRRSTIPFPSPGGPLAGVAPLSTA